MSTIILTPDTSTVKMWYNLLNLQPHVWKRKKCCCKDIYYILLHAQVMDINSKHRKFYAVILKNNKIMAQRVSSLVIFRTKISVSKTIMHEHSLWISITQKLLGVSKKFKLHSKLQTFSYVKTPIECVYQKNRFFAKF